MVRLKRLLAPFIAATLFTGALQAQAEQRTLRVFNWFDYITPQTLTEFQKDSGVKLVYDIFDTNEALEAKLLTGNSGYDVVVPSNVFLAKQIEAGVFQPLDRSKLPNWQHLDPALMKLIEANDPGNKFAVPYMYGTVLIGFNPAKVKAALGENAPVDSWDLIFKEENIAKLKQCGVALLDSPSEIMPATAVAMRRLASRFSSARRANGGSEPRSRRLRAPPRKRSSTPWAARISRSRRMVDSETRSVSARSGSAANPRSRTNSNRRFLRSSTITHVLPQVRDYYWLNLDRLQANSIIMLLRD